MMQSNKAALVIIAWLGLLAVAVLSSVVSTFAAGVAAGSVLTAGALLLAVKWSIEGMLEEAALDVESMSETLAAQQESMQQHRE